MIIPSAISSESPAKVKSYRLPVRCLTLNASVLDWVTLLLPESGIRAKVARYCCLYLIRSVCLALGGGSWDDGGIWMLKPV